MIEKSLTVDARWPQPARKLLTLVQQLLKMGEKAAAGVILAGGVRVNGRLDRRTHAKLEIGDRIDVQYEPEEVLPAKKRPPALPLVEILYQDDYLAVVNKPPHLLTVPTPRRERETLIALLQTQLRQTNAAAEAFCVHRLDRGVSGLLVFGKQLEIAKKLRDQFAERKPTRTYVVIIAGQLETEHGTFRSHLATDDELNRFSTDDEEQGELAITHYKVLRGTPEATVVEVTLETGRRNQIRVHFAEAGHPVLGDTRYGQRELQQHWPHRRLALHAQRLGFVHPVSGQAVSWESPLPWEMQSFDAPRGPRR